MARTMIGLRVNEAALANIDKIAAEADTTRSTVVRVLLGEALADRSVRSSALARLSAMKERA